MGAAALALPVRSCCALRSHSPSLFPFSVTVVEAWVSALNLCFLARRIRISRSCSARSVVMRAGIVVERVLIEVVWACRREGGVRMPNMRRGSLDFVGASSPFVAVDISFSFSSSFNFSKPFTPADASFPPPSKSVRSCSVNVDTVTAVVLVVVLFSEAPWFWDDVVGVGDTA